MNIDKLCLLGTMFFEKLLQNFYMGLTVLAYSKGATVCLHTVRLTYCVITMRTLNIVQNHNREYTNLVRCKYKYSCGVITVKIKTSTM